MTDGRWHRLAEIVPEALARPPAERDAFLDRACTRADGAPDAGLRAEAAALVAASDAADAAGALASPVRAFATDLPDTIGPWRVTGLLGEGGMGVVYRAERADGLFERTVALKRIRPELARTLAGRLDAERAALARLEHDGIARLYDGGVSDAGVPYLVMELADGCAITEHAETAGLDAPARVRLFVAVCDAVAYAHTRLVVHRDLKPSNVFVTPDGRPKLLDFGIARILGDGTGETDAALATRTHASMTPTYAAPEQLRRGEITTASDVYALGVMLYELLAGRRPYSLAGASPAEAERIVCETVPPLPSTVADRARDVRGDLDVICLKALAKEPRQRYASAEALAADLQRHLDGLPVLARAPTRRYRAGRFVRRHRLGVLATAVTAAALVGGTGVALWQARVARAEAAKATAITAFLQATLAAAGPSAGPALRPSDLRVVDVLRPAAAAAAVAFPEQPGVRAALLHTIGRTFLDLGLYDDAAGPLREAARLRAAARPDAEQAETADALALLAMWRPDLGDAAALHARAVRLRDAVYGPASAEAAVGRANFAEWWVEREDYPRALALLGRARAIIDAGPGEASVPGAEVLFVYAVAALRGGRLREADAAFARLDAFGRALVAAGSIAPDDDRIATVRIGLGQTRLLLGRTADARRLLADALARRSARYDAGHPVLAEAQALCGIALLASGQPADAVPLLDAAAPGLAGGDPYTEQRHLARLALALATPGRPADTRPLRADVAAVRDRLGPGHPWTRYAERTFAAVARR